MIFVIEKEKLNLLVRKSLLFSDFDLNKILNGFHLFSPLLSELDLIYIYINVIELLACWEFLEYLPYFTYQIVIASAMKIEIMLNCLELGITFEMRTL